MANQSWINDLRVASPCPVAWSDLTGEERVRFCNLCKKNVYNISEMNRREAEELVKSNEGNLCVRMYIRKDGTILTNDCPVGLRKVRDVIFWAVAAAASVVCSFLSGQATMASPEQKDKQKPVGAIKPKTKRCEVMPLMGAIAPSKDYAPPPQKLDQDLESWAKMIQSDPKSVEAYLGHGRVLEQLGRLDEAEKDYKQALSINPTYQPTLDALKKLAERKAPANPPAPKP